MFEENCQFFVSCTKFCSGFGREPWFLINILALEVLVSIKNRFLIKQTCMYHESLTYFSGVYQTEEAEKPQRAAILQPRNAFLTPGQFRRARGGARYRSLTEIIQDDEIYEHLHKSFSWILKSSGLRYTEKLLGRTVFYKKSITEPGFF